MSITTKNTEQKILTAAKYIFQQKGMDGARMQEIANKAGINKALLHYYYKNKQILFEAVFYQAFKVLAPKLSEILNSDLQLFAKIKAFTNGYIDFVIKHPYLPNFIIQELNRDSDFASKLIQRKDFPTINIFKLQIEHSIKKGEIKLISTNQLFINMISLTVFPFIGAPLLKGFTELSDKAYQNLLTDRKTEIANFIINAIKK